MNKNVFVFCEQRDGEIQKVAFELVGKARELADAPRPGGCRRSGRLQH